MELYYNVKFYELNAFSIKKIENFGANYISVIYVLFGLSVSSQITPYAN